MTGGKNSYKILLFYIWSSRERFSIALKSHMRWTGEKNQTTAETDSKIKGPSLNIENKIQIKGITHN